MKEYITACLRTALESLGIGSDEEILLEKPKQEAHGDLSTNIAMVLAKKARVNPREFAKKITERIQDSREILESIDIAGPGFINFTFSKKYFTDSLYEISKNEEYGRSATNAGKTINVEWVSANPTGPLHAGHGRQICLGATICSLLEWNGWTVTREYYFNNAGSQMNGLAMSVRERYLEAVGLPVASENILYVGEYVIEIGAAIKAAFGASKVDAPLDFFREQGETWCFGKIKESLDELHVIHDVFFNESSLYDNGMIDEALQVLRSKDLVYDMDGAVWLRTTTFGADKDRVIIKNTGEPTYRLPDIAYHCDKVARGYDRLIDIFGADHIATFPDVLNAVYAMGFRTDHITVIIHQMVSFVNEGEAVKMSKRSGNVYYLNDLIRDVGADAVRYFFVMRGANAHLEFDIKLAQEQSENNPVYYLQYAHARIASIIRFATSEGYVMDRNASTALLAHPSEISLIKTLLEFPDIVSGCSQSLEPHHLCTYLHEVATAFHKFYHDCRVVIDDPDLRSARLSLCIATRRVLANGLSIIGISAPEKM